MSRLSPLNTIRPNLSPPVPQPAQGAEAGRLSAAKAFFALASGGQGPSSAVSALVQVQDTAATAPITRAAGPADPQKIARPGSLFDIRV